MLISLQREHALDAVRVSDGRQVHLKHVKRSSPEVEIGKLLSAAHIQSDPKNHACPFLDVLEDEIDEEYVIIVMPLLRDADDPSPKSIRECLEFMDQVLEVRAYRWLRTSPHSMAIAGSGVAARKRDSS